MDSFWVAPSKRNLKFEIEDKSQNIWIDKIINQLYDQSVVIPTFITERVIFSSSIVRLWSSPKYPLYLS